MQRLMGAGLACNRRVEGNDEAIDEWKFLGL